MALLTKWKELNGTKKTFRPVTFFFLSLTFESFSGIKYVILSNTHFSLVAPVFRATL